MSSDLVVGGQAGPNFAQQGSVDWVSLSGSTLSFSLEVMSRFSKAGVEMITVAMGQALFSGFKVPPAGQKRLSDAVAKLKAFSSYGNVLWFGFGIKHVVRTLCETEQGATCAGICACLSVSYDSFFASKVLKALADCSLAPNTLTPSLSQWGALMNVCAGAVIDSSFPNTVEGFSRLLGHPSGARTLPPLYEPTTSKALAGALLELAKISNGSLRSVTFQGGIDCAWLAAVSQWFLNLRVEVIDASGACVYSNLRPNSDLHAQVIIVQDSSETSHRDEATALSRSYFVPSGQLCFGILDEAALGDASHPHRFSRGRTDWESILHSTFGWAADELLQPKYTDRLVTFLCSGFKLPESGDWLHDMNLSCLTPWGFLSVDTTPQIIRRFISFAAAQLPELKHLLHIAVPNITDKTGTREKGFPKVLAEICPCSKCSSRSVESVESLCLERVGFTIWRYLWILSWCDIHDSIKPSPNGLLMLYYTHAYKDDNFAVLRTRLWQRGLNRQLTYLFNGTMDSREGFKALSALCEGGICIFYHILKDVDVDPFQIVRHTVVPGQIERGGLLYRQITDRNQARDVLRPSVPISEFLSKYAPDVCWKLVVEETLNSSVLEASFEIMARPISCKISEHIELPSDSGQRSYSESNWNCASKGITATRSSILENLHSPACRNRQVMIGVAPRLSPKFSTWTGKCSEVISECGKGGEEISKYCPAQAEWTLIRYWGNSGGLMRGNNLLLYSALLYDPLVAYPTLVYTNRCFLDPIDKYCSGALKNITVYSVVDKVPSAVKLIESIEWLPTETHKSEMDEGTGSSSDTDIHNENSQKRDFYARQRKKELESFLNRRGINFKSRLSKDDLVTLLAEDDLRHPHAASEDGFVDEDSQDTDVEMDDAA